MTITIQSKYSHETNSNNTEDSTLKELKKLFENTVMKDEETEDISAKWISDNEIVLNKMPSMSLHTFLLHVEKMGKSVEFSKQTVIKIVD